MPLGSVQRWLSSLLVSSRKFDQCLNGKQIFRQTCLWFRNYSSVTWFYPESLPTTGQLDGDEDFTVAHSPLQLLCSAGNSGRKRRSPVWWMASSVPSGVRPGVWVESWSDASGSILQKPWLLAWLQTSLPHGSKICWRLWSLPAG